MAQAMGVDSMPHQRLIDQKGSLDYINSLKQLEHSALTNINNLLAFVSCLLKPVNLADYIY